MMNQFDLQPMMPMIQPPVQGARLDGVPPIVQNVLRAPGQPLNTAARSFMEPRFGHDFSGINAQARKNPPIPARLAVGAPEDAFELEAEKTAKRVTGHQAATSGKGYDFSGVRVHTDAQAGESARAIGALAYTVGSHVVFDTSQASPSSPEGRHVLAHELTHVVQQSNALQAYRSKKSFNFGKKDDKRLVEDSFTFNTDKEKKPWIRRVKVAFASKKTDSDGNNYWAGTAAASYYPNAVKWPDFTFPITGGSAELGRSDAGKFWVHRIEGAGYNSGTNSGVEGVDYQASEREATNKRYSKDVDNSNMSFAVFYNRGEALHAGPLDYSSHGCVHVDWNDDSQIKQLNYHSVIGATEVDVTYP